MMCPRKHAAGLIVDLQREFFTQGPRVYEQQRRAVVFDSLDKVRRKGVPQMVFFTSVTRGCRVPHPQAVLLRRLGTHHGYRARFAFTQSAHVVGHHLNGLYGSAQRDTLKLTGEWHKAFNGCHEVHAAFVRHDVVNFIENDGLETMQHCPPTFGRQQQVQTLRSGDENFRGVPEHAAAVTLICIPAARLNPHPGEADASGFRQHRKFLQRLDQVALHVVVQRLQRTHIQHAGCTGFERTGQELVDGPEERRQRFAATRGCADDDMFT